MSPLLEVREFEAGYDGTCVAAGLALHVEGGEVVALLGSNGAGKTTLLKAIAGILPRVSGVLEFDGVSLFGIPPHERARRGLILVPEGRRLFPELSVLENLQVGTLARNHRGDPDKDRELVFSLFPVLAQKAKQLAMTLSGGEQQMLALGRGLMSAPRLLLIDEPSLGLAPLVARGLFQALRVLANRGLAIFLAEQNLRLALHVAQRGYVLRAGQIIFQGPASTLSARSDLPEMYWGRISTPEQEA